MRASERLTAINILFSLLLHTGRDPIHPGRNRRLGHLLQFLVRSTVEGFPGGFGGVAGTHPGVPL